MGKSTPVAVRFNQKVIQTSTCWNWSGHKNRGGYSVLWFDGKNRYAHRISYNLFKGKIKKGFCIDHLCRNRECVNPNHLEMVTIKTNVNRGLSKKTHCKNGHQYTKEFTIKWNGNQRRCAICLHIQGKKKCRILHNAKIKSAPKD